MSEETRKYEGGEGCEITFVHSGQETQAVATNLQGGTVRLAIQTHDNNENSWTGHSHDLEIEMVIELRDFLNRHLDSLAFRGKESAE